MGWNATFFSKRKYFIILDERKFKQFNFNFRESKISVYSD